MATIDLPPELIALMCPNGESPDVMANEILASHLLWSGRITGGRVARALDLSRPEFIRFCERYDLLSSPSIEAGWDDDSAQIDS